MNTRAGRICRLVLFSLLFVICVDSKGGKKRKAAAVSAGDGCTALGKAAATSGGYGQLAHTVKSTGSLILLAYNMSTS